ncbi:ABC transporter permease subunit [Hominifimenecus sp. rT4P-3]|uniref:ABC transporter permease subunit n=1 Tax=Hominifimenecus sp. rT4P-3 TaxID=3242979 RepID=UPI003DA30271
MGAIYKRELKSYFTSLTGYLFMAFILFFIGLYFTSYNLSNYYVASFTYPLYSVNFVFMIVIPILTMRTLAEDRKSKTDQLLLTSPVSVTKIILGKYLAMVSVYFLVCLICAFGPLVLSQYGSPNLKTDYAMLLAFFLSGCAYLAIGLYISSLTESPVLACIGTFGALLILYLISDIGSLIPIDKVGALFQNLSIQQRLMNFTGNLFDISSLVYFLSIAGFFVFMSVQSVNKRRWH